MKLWLWFVVACDLSVCFLLLCYFICLIWLLIDYLSVFDPCGFAMWNWLLCEFWWPQENVEIHQDCSHLKLVTMSFTKQTSPQLFFRHSLKFSKLFWLYLKCRNIDKSNINTGVRCFCSVVSLLLRLQYDYEDI